MKNKAIKIVALILMAVLVVTALSQVAFAREAGDDDTMDATDMTFSDFSMSATGAKDGGASKAISRIIASVINMVQIVGMGVAIIMLVVLAIKYISASPGDKAEIKKHAVVYIVGAVILFAATGILQIVKNFAAGTIGDGSEEEV